MDLKVRLKKTDMGLIPEGWDSGLVGQVTIKVGSGITPAGGERVYKSEGRPFIRSQNVGWGRLLLDDVAYIDDAMHNSFPETEIVAGDVFLNISGASIGRSSVANKDIEGGNVNQHVCIIRADTHRLEPQFLNYVLLSELGQRQIDSFQTGGSRQGLNFSQVKSIRLPLPSIDEQRSIAKTLSDVDFLSDALDCLIKKKAEIKKATMQKLLTGEWRLPGFDEEWKVIRLGDMGKTYGGITGKSKIDFGQGSGLYITFMNVMSNVVIDSSSFERVDILPSETQNLVKKGDLFFNGSSETPEEVAMCAALLEDVKDVYLNSFCFGFRFHDEVQADGVFLAYYFRSQEGRELMKSLAQGSTRYNLSKVALMNSMLRIPIKAEQVAIAKVLFDMDSELNLLESRRKKTSSLKKGMLQDLLMGRTRLV